jgi:hypothetical protein
MNRQPWHRAAFKWTNKTIEAVREALGVRADDMTDAEIYAILTIAIKEQELDLLLALVRRQLSDLMQLNEEKWDLINELVKGNAEPAIRAMDKEKEKKRIPDFSNVIKFKR